MASRTALGRNRQLSSAHEVDAIPQFALPHDMAAGNVHLRLESHEERVAHGFVRVPEQRDPINKVRCEVKEHLQAKGVGQIAEKLLGTDPSIPIPDVVVIVLKLIIQLGWKVPRSQILIQAIDPVPERGLGRVHGTDERRNTPDDECIHRRTQHHDQHRKGVLQIPVWCDISVADRGRGYEAPVQGA